MTTAFAPPEISCATHSVEFVAMGNDWRIEARGISEEALSHVPVLVEREERRCWSGRPDSLLSELNRERHVTDGMLALMVAQALAMRDATAGAFDPAIGDAMQAATEICEADGRAAVEASTVGRSSMGVLRPTVTGQRIQLEGEGELDLAGMDKGWTTDLVARYLRGVGATQWLIRVGDDTVVGGEEDEERLVDIESTELTIGITSGAVSTSMMWKADLGVQTGPTARIIDPSQGMPGDHKYVKAVVIAKSAAIADALATAMLADPERGDRALASHQAAAVLITRRGDAFMSPEMDRYLR